MAAEQDVDGGPVVFECSAEGPEVRGVSSALDLIGEAWGTGAEVVVVPVERVADDFFSLRSGVAGDLTQKFAQYGVRLVVLGDISDRVARGTALRDFVREANRGRHVWFAATREELAARLAAG
ncbi:DUF4180 domain-containing protein [Streptomonospora nanhaiensis]|uniref:DUF4180 domain-containing protein n=1 Tax=Streptomonospora nanhaiensis TaxID=1323731 RepID=A0A853BPF6_9ACTN|nr:DUF4180 domain-containing protein [Streptomonospora nanhaiensis]MBX9390112.1 DUF4180 domain-containing protein [Streptomonospora nanhaiensis]NYI97328.1 hypothetical protein [Streptomonospora nanhaiensis]